jgi:hypothetical protein
VSAPSHFAPLFFSTPEQCAALARERFFEEGERPVGLVNDAVLQSWLRCSAAGKRIEDRLAAEPLSPLRMDTALRRSRQLREAARSGLACLESALAGTSRCSLIMYFLEGQAAPTDGTLQVNGAAPSWLSRAPAYIPE